MTYIEIIEKHTEELVNTIRKIKKLPKRKEYYFSDGVDMYNFYTSLISINIDNKFVGKKLNDKELEIVKKSLTTINNALKKINKFDENNEALKVAMKKESSRQTSTAYTKNLININNKDFENTIITSTNEIVEFIGNKKRLPLYDELKLTNEVDARTFMINLSKIYMTEKDINIKRKKNELLTAKNCLIKLKDTLKIYNLSYPEEMTHTDRTNEIINVVLSTGKLPTDECFEDGLGEYKYYVRLKTYYETVLKKKELTESDEEIKECYLYIQWILKYVRFRKMYEKHGKMHILSSKDSKLRKWYLEQIQNYYKNNKSSTQIEHEELLTEIDPNWMGNSYRVLDDEKIKYIQI